MKFEPFHKDRREGGVPVLQAAYSCQYVADRCFIGLSAMLGERAMRGVVPRIRSFVPTERANALAFLPREKGRELGQVWFLAFVYS